MMARQSAVSDGEAHYFVIDKRGIIRYKHIMEEAGHLLDAEEIFNTVKRCHPSAVT
jgi:hypothetical protein